MATKWHKKLVIGWLDISLAGCRALLGSKSCHLKSEELDLNQSLFDNRLESLITFDDFDVHAVSKIDCKDQEVSMVSLSAHLSTGQAPHIFDKLLDICNANEVEEIVIVAALQMTLKSLPEAEVYQIAFNTKEVDDIPCLPSNFVVKDSILKLLIQFLQVEGIPTRCFVTQGYRAKSGTPNEKDGSQQSIANLQRLLHLLYKIDFDQDRTAKLKYEDVQKTSSSNFMYL
eukprot:gene15003-16552_t